MDRVGLPTVQPDCRGIVFVFGSSAGNLVLMCAKQASKKAFTLNNFHFIFK